MVKALLQSREHAEARGQIRASQRRWLLPCLVASLALSFASAASLSAAELSFRRGDSNDDGVTDISDGIATLLFLFSGGAAPDCEDAADADDSGFVDLTDGVYTFSYLFTGGVQPPAPGPGVCGPDPTADELSCDISSNCDQAPVGGDIQQIGHVLNRLGYGPTIEAVDHVKEVGVEAYIEEQLSPELIDESGNTALNTRIEALFEDRVPSIDTRLVTAGQVWSYFKGTVAPPTDWASTEFDDSAWLQGPTGIGYGDGDDLTVLDDMRRLSDDPETPDVDESQPGYVSVYMRVAFTINDLAAIENLILRNSYDDGFVAYLNGRLVTRASMPSGTIRFDTTANSHEADGFEEFDLTSRIGFLQEGRNVLAIEGHNTNYTSSDFSSNPELISREILPGDPIRTIRDVDALQELVHVRGVYSERQLQAVMAEFWENHFTTDADKLVEYFDSLQNSDASDAMDSDQAEREAAQVEFEEYEFFYDNAFGHFGDLLLYSATSPSMNVYLDNILNVKGNANENYSREILELFALGVDNRYVQRDIEELGRAFTGWTVCKIDPSEKQSFPDSARNPVEDCGVEFEDTEFLGLGAGWVYFKGTEEPTPDAQGEPTTAWAGADFDATGWLPGSTGIGYGDGDDATVLDDMRNNYYSVYARREFTVDNPFEDFKNLILEVTYDDGYVAYLNGVEIGRSETMEDEGNPPEFDEDADDTHEISDGVDYLNLNRFLGLLRPAPATNVLSFQVHNASRGSSDLSLRPRLLDREILPGSVENGDTNGVWAFRFNAEDHDTDGYTIFQGTPFQHRVPRGRTGQAGVQDAIEVVDSLAEHPSTIEFISVKLIQRFVSDGITLANFKDGTAPIELRELMADMQAAWLSTPRPGNIRTVLRTLLDPSNRENVFWSELAFRSKVKTPIEFINSSLRIVESTVNSDPLPGLNEDMGMYLFTRDEPDGWSELGFDWIDTATMLERIEAVRELSSNSDTDLRWNVLGYMDSRGLDTSAEIVDFVDEYFFQNQLPQENRDTLLEFLNTNDSGTTSTLNRSSSTTFRTRVQDFMGLVLSMPQWHFQ